MKRLLFSIVFVIFGSVCFSTCYGQVGFSTPQQRTVYRSVVFNGHDCPNTVLTLGVDEYGAYYISVLTESGDTTLGTLCIGYDISQAKTTMERMQYFLEHDDLEYILIHIGENIFLKLFKDEECYMDEGDLVRYFTTYLTDGTEICITIPEQFVKKARKKL